MIIPPINSWAASFFYRGFLLFVSLAECKTEWLDLDNPFGTGDHELLSQLLDKKPGEICPDPTAMEVQTLNGTPASETGQQFAV